MLVVAARADEQSDIVEQSRHLQVQPLHICHPVFRLQSVKDQFGDGLYALGMPFVILVFASDTPGR